MRFGGFFVIFWSRVRVTIAAGKGITIRIVPNLAGHAEIGPKFGSKFA